MKFEVIGTPVAKGRPRLGRFGTYTPTKTINYENLVKISYLNTYKNQEIIIGPTKVNIIAIFPIPKSYSKKQREYILKENNYHTKKSDIDNICKIILDALNGIAYKDDSQISELIAKKIYGKEPKVIVEIEMITK